jgi:hypothetical protein
LKLDKLETHDRLLQFGKQADYISKGFQECINNRPHQFTMPFYIFAHQRTIDMDERISAYEYDLISSHLDPTYIRQFKSLAEVPCAKLIWAPRLSKPTPQQNSMLFKAYPGTDDIKVIWMIPAQEMWAQYEKGFMLQSSIVVDSIHKFKNDFENLKAPEEDDLPDERVNEIYASIARDYGNKKFEMI